MAQTHNPPVEHCVERCPQCGHVELSDGYGGYDCPECDTRMKVERCSALESVIIDVLLSAETCIDAADIPLVSSALLKSLHDYIHTAE